MAEAHESGTPLAVPPSRNVSHGNVQDVMHKMIREKDCFFSDIMDAFRDG